jgi:hypothetical protein
MEDLNTLMRHYSQGLLNKKEVEGRIFQFILDNTRRFHLFNWEKDKCADYLCWLYPRLSKAIDHYKDKGSSFETYIGSLVYWSAREYRSREQDHQIKEYVCWKTMAQDMVAREGAPLYLDSEKKAFKNESGKKIRPKEILILLLKSYSFISDDFLECAAPITGVKPEKLRKMIAVLKNIREKHDEDLRELKMCIHSQYYRCINFEKRLAGAPKDSVVYEKMKERLDRARIRLANMKKRLSKTRPDASNRQVAAVLGIPKGTVDSCLSALKKKFTDENFFL